MENLKTRENYFQWQGLLLAFIFFLLLAMAATWFWYDRKLEELDQKQGLQAPEFPLKK